MAHFILVHGFNDASAGANNIDRLEPYLTALGHTVDKDEQDYGHYNLLQVRFARYAAVSRIEKALRAAILAGKDVNVVAYSNGANFAIKAIKLLIFGYVKFVGIHPALSTRFDVPPAVSAGWIYYTKSDWTVRWASYITWLIPGWGRAGAVGYKGKDPRIKSRDYSDVAYGHGGLFKDTSLEIIATHLHNFAEEKV